jgi:hypothetical protein
MTRHRIAIAAACAVALTAFLGCAGNRSVPRADYIHGPLPHQARRAPDYAGETFWARLAPEAYEPMSAVPAQLSPDQDLAVREFGPPEYRREFESLEGEDVLEWLDLDHDTLFQFIDGELVYQGEIRDLEHALLRYGYPNEAIYHLQEANVERLTFVYEPPYAHRRRIVSFANGIQVFEERHN